MARRKRILPSNQRRRRSVGPEWAGRAWGHASRPWGCRGSPQPGDADLAPNAVPRRVELRPVERFETVADLLDQIVAQLIDVRCQTVFVRGPVAAQEIIAHGSILLIKSGVGDDLDMLVS